VFFYEEDLTFLTEKRFSCLELMLETDHQLVLTFHMMLVGMHHLTNVLGGNINHARLNRFLIDL
jgi:hypothetical protein